MNSLNLSSAGQSPVSLNTSAVINTAEDQFQAVDPVIVADFYRWTHSEGMCRLVHLKLSEQSAVIFISDNNTTGRSITNTIENLISQANQALKLQLEEAQFPVRYFELRVGNLTADHVPQEPGFAEISMLSGRPVWFPPRGLFCKKVAQALGISI